MTTGSREDDYIARSHARCAAHGIEGSLVHSRRIIEGAELAARLAARRGLIEAGAPVAEGLRGFVRGAGFFGRHTEAEGCILSVQGDPGILAEATALRMVPGAFMDEASIGTNAMGTTLAEGFPLQVSGAEHYIAAYRRWTCSGAPIRDPAGRVVGALDLTGYSADVHLHTLGMVVAAVAAVENLLALGEREASLRSHARFTDVLLDSIEAGIVSAALDGRILSANAQAALLFGLDRDALRARRAEALFEGWDSVLAAFLAGREFQNEDVPVAAASNRLLLNLSAYPVRDEAGAPTAVILVFKDVRKVRRHADQILGRRALYTFDKILGDSPAMREAKAFAEGVAAGRSTILISGESGTGKEVFAQAIQNASPRRNEAFVVLNCGAIPRTLIESELFGYVEGAFTGAKRGGQPGKFEVADGGTIFLDEIGEMPLDMQVRLLRVIEEGTVSRIGGTREIPVDVRIIAATNKDLAAEVARGNFRMDLFYRLNVLPLRLPALRERPEDLPLLLDHYMRKISRKLNRRPVPVPPAYLEALARSPWPGNVRELENFIELVVSTERLPPLPGSAVGAPSPATYTRPEGLEAGPLGDEKPAGVDPAGAAATGAATAASAGAEPEALLPLLSLEELEGRHIRRVLAATGGNVTRAAAILGIGRNTLYRKLEHFGIPDSGEAPGSEDRSIAEQRSILERDLVLSAF
ncbi:MAG: sigma 54-interacting transcriptional regulator [Spirochaetaceae bacterium]|nr:sigma 54-interacting transcriptional regulator [Spirochaetaceae bacterium]